MREEAKRKKPEFTRRTKKKFTFDDDDANG